MSAPSGPFMFGVTRVRPNPVDVPTIERIAHEHECSYIEGFFPGTGFQAWFETRNYGFPFDDARAKAVLSAIAYAGIEYGTEPEVRS
jgi:hypothetical protein